MKYQLNTFEDRLRRKTRRIVQFQAVYGFLMGLISVGILFYSISILVYFAPQIFFFYIPSKVLIGILISAPFAAGFLAGYWERKDTRTLTLKLEKQYPHLGDRLLTLVEISRRPGQIENDPFSRMLAKSLEADMDALMGRFNFNAAASLRKALLPALLFVACLSAGTLHALVQPDFFLTSFRRLTQPLAPDFKPFSFFKRDAFEIKVVPGDSEIACPRAVGCSKEP